MYNDQVKDNKVRLSRDVLDKAQMIADEWGLKNARAAVEAVFRRYADEYMGGTAGTPHGAQRANMLSPSQPSANQWVAPPKPQPTAIANNCEALDVLDELLGA
ncbi:MULTISPECIES: hypothetical protein [unclassified Leptolyngbya]|uniref:hypothetical protein n=1 Tax=unclassified Leptolyngbya TaxID=2650499 RepID=UPI001688F75E|nr:MULTISPECIES: hypothetical protein [unclassified Leptolyngbya]MBD1911367.1 hypothetical protein [Leptolyngbya sp. FACHB-8]MBD2156615.1 hypothetical protein [Leptolyngbya sp. FACHB-16]